MQSVKINRNFNDIYKEIYKNAVNEINKLRIKSLATTFVTVLILGITTFLFFHNGNLSIIVVGIFISLLCLFYTLKNRENYNNAYKKLIMTRMVYLYNQNLVYKANKGISQRIYRESFFDNDDYDKYYSEDYISGQIDDKTSIEMAQVRTTKETVTVGSDGKPQHSTTQLFCGVFGVVDIGDRILAKIEINSDNFLNKYAKDRIEVDSNEFEQKYDMFSTDKVRTMEIFTSDLIEELNKFYDETKYTIQLRVSFNKLYFRIKCGDVFEVPLVKNSLDYKTLYKTFRLFDFPIDVILKILRNADETRR